MEYKNLEEMLHIAKGKGDRKSEFKLKDRILFLKNNLPPKGHVKDENDFEKLDAIKKYLESNKYLLRSEIKDYQLMNARYDLLASLNLYIYNEKYFAGIKELKRRIIKALAVLPIAAMILLLAPEKIGFPEQRKAELNECYNGKVPLITFHAFNNSGKRYSMPLEEFEKSLPKLRDRGYYLASVSEYFENRFKSSRKPLILTFDDGYSGQPYAIRIIEDFSEKNNDFGKAVILSLNDPLHSLGIEKNPKIYDELRKKGWISFANHTRRHKNLRSLTTKGVLNDITQTYQGLETVLKEDVLKVNILTCPYGILPKPEAIEAIKNYTYQSKYGPVKIDYIFGEFGPEPESSSNSKNFSRWDIKRTSIDNKKILDRFLAEKN